MPSTSYSHAPSSSVSPPSPTLWDVFLSFRGIDTRYTFTDHLYKDLQRVDIRTFMDNPDLRSGERISDALVKAIHESKTYVVVLSENYASSRWCLDELVEILNCYKTMDRLVIPVFYNIEPAVVRHQIQEFAKAFEKHETRFEMERLAKWRVTLAELGEISGYPVGKDTSEASIVNEIVGRILFHISPETLHIAKYPVGLDSRVEKITSMFSTSTRIGIHGMGGVGKTTLAKAVYNKHYRSFQGSCFLKNVREESATEKGLMRLQKQLIHNVLKRKDIVVKSVDSGIELIKSTICATKLLLVIDDLADPSKLHYLEGPFCLGSIIIITTRNEDLLDTIHVEARYKVNELDDAEARQLFTYHAFRDNQIPHALNELSQEVIERAGGLPLALEVFGLMLINKDEEGWKCIMDKIKRACINDVKKTLMISFDGSQLDYDQQHIFLDIACLFIGREETEVIKILETYYKSVVHNVDVLKKRSLLTINRRDSRDNLMAMHHQLRDMGRDIARNDSPREPEKHSRLWVSEDICNVLKKKKGTAAIEGIIPAIESVKPAMSLVTETFTKMSRLRFLYLENVTLTGNFEDILEDLRWLYWCGCPLKCFPPTFYPQGLLVLELPHSKLRTTWEQNVVMPVFHNLKTLNLSYSLDLTTIPDFTKLPTLETLNLEGCKNLEEVHVSIGSLTSLVSLNLCGCLKLSTLPHSICNLRALEVLSTANCCGLKAFPKELGNIESLKLVTRLRDLVAGNITDSSGRREIRGLKELTSVRRLHVGGCNSSLLANTLTERFFKVYSGFGRQINFYIGKAEFPVWIDQSNNFGSTVCLDLGSDNFWAMMICFKRRGNILHYSVENTTSESIWSDSFGNSDDESLIVIVPESIFSLRDGDNTIKLSANGEIHGYHLFSKTEIKMIDEDVSTTVNDAVELMNADRGSDSHLLEDREEVGCWSCLGGDFWRRWKPFGLVMTCDGEEEANVNLSGANGLFNHLMSREP